LNAIDHVKTVSVDGPGGPANAMMMALNVGDPAGAEASISEVAEQFKLHRMVAPPDTSMQLVTIIGGLPAERFAAWWQQIAGRDGIVGAFMSLMVVADVVQGTPAGQQLSKASLLAAAAPQTSAGTERRKPWWKFW
jgi:hypothetical protein